LRESNSEPVFFGSASPIVQEFRPVLTGLDPVNLSDRHV